MVQHRYGSPDAVLELRDVPLPLVGDDDVLVRVHAASVHPDVWHLVTGRPYILRLIGVGLFKPRNAIPGTDVAGTVESAGRNVTRFRPGDAVFGETTVVNGWSKGGAYAEYVSVRQEQLALKPDNVTFEQAASVPTSGQIALQNLREPAQQLGGKKVLVNGAGGGVGALVLQIAKAYEAYVTAVDCTRKLDMLRSLGANEVIDYTREDFTQRDDEYDLIVDIPGNHSFTACRRVLNPGGRYVLIGHDRFAASSGRMFGIFPQFFKLVFLSRFVKQLRGPRNPLPTTAESIVTLRELIENGRITPVIDTTYPLQDVAKAIRHLQEGPVCGKIIITP